MYSIELTMVVHRGDRFIIYHAALDHRCVRA